MNKNIIILGIESSCDDTSAAIISNQYMLSNIISTQDVHREYGGVVPELASREHQKNIIPVVDLAIKRAKIKKEDISAIAFTKGPGLLGSLIVGSSFAKSFALGMNIPLISVNHMKGHVLSHFIKTKGEKKEMPNFPFLCLTVSGGHTQIVLVKSISDMIVIGETLDDAAGEAFDKSAKIMGLPYPGGPLIDKYARTGDKTRFIFGKHKVKELNFSYSGIKTSILRVIQKGKLEDPNFINKNLNDLCASIQHCIVDILVNKILKASEDLEIEDIAIAGGVSANSYLRERMMNLRKKGKNIFIPRFEYCTDNAAMIAVSGYYQYLNNDFSNHNVIPQARFPIN